MTANLSRILTWARHRFAGTDALVFEGRRWTYPELDDEVHAVAAGLLELGVRRGDVVAILSLNRPEYLFTALAAARVGAVFLPLNYRLHAEELSYALTHSGAVALVTEEGFHEMGGALAKDCPALAHLVSMDSTAPEGWRSLEEVAGAHRGERVPDADAGRDDIQRIMYTSGTTARPKGALLTHGNVNANIDVQVADLGLTRRERVLVFGPLYHVGGLDLPGVAVWHVGGTIVLMRRFDPLSILETVAAERVTGMCMVATMVHMLGEHTRRKRPDTSSVRWIIFSQVPPAMFREVAEVFPGARVIEGYGLTETCNGIAYLDEAHMWTKPGSTGRPVHRVDIAIVDEEDLPVPAGTRGEIVVRGDKVCAGYHADPEATAEAFRGGWFHTGDIGYLDDDGYLFVVDRKKDMIRSGGENIASSEIERVVYELPDVVEAAVVAEPHERWGEVPLLFAVARPGSGLGPGEILEHCEARLGGFKVPKRVIMISELPRNPSGKILKRSLRANL